VIACALTRQEPLEHLQKEISEKEAEKACTIASN
jgi:hypothetical protein